VGKNTAYNETQTVTVSDGQLNIAFRTIADNAKISAIKVLKPENGTGLSRQIPVPTETQLAYNYPNPFNSATTIPYQPAKASHVKLSIHNFLGQHVNTLVNEPQSAGYHTVNWNGNDSNGKPMASGIYIYRMETDYNSIHTKKSILTR
jgi:hypothetical protein